MAAVMHSFAREPGKIYKGDSVQWFDHSEFSLRWGRVVAIDSNAFVIADANGSTHDVRHIDARLWHLTFLPSPSDLPKC